MTLRATPTPVTVRVFRQQFSATRRGARLARRLAMQQLDAWDIPYGTDASDAIALIVAELASNAVFHGYVPGRDFAVLLEHRPGTAGVPGTVRIEVHDALGERRDVRPAPKAPEGEAEADRGRGLLLVEALADRWGVCERVGAGKTVWAEYAL
jgi:anti-sigma regulatory factor (Ser/Thr protein kinase)